MFKTSVQEIGSILFLHDREDVKSCDWDLRICSSAEANTTSAETRQPGCEALLLTSAWSRVPGIAFPSAQFCMRPPPHWHGRAPASWRWCIRFVRSACNVRPHFAWQVVCREGLLLLLLRNHSAELRPGRFALSCKAGSNPATLQRRTADSQAGPLPMLPLSWPSPREKVVALIGTCKRQRACPRGGESEELELVEDTVTYDGHPSATTTGRPCFAVDSASLPGLRRSGGLVASVILTSKMKPILWHIAMRMG